MEEDAAGDGVNDDGAFGTDGGGAERGQVWLNDVGPNDDGGIRSRGLPWAAGDEEGRD